MFIVTEYAALIILDYSLLVEGLRQKIIFWIRSTSRRAASENYFFDYSLLSEGLR